MLELFSLIPLELEWGAAVDHPALSLEGFVHSVEDVIVRLTANEGEGVYLIAGYCAESAHFVEDVLGEELAT